MTHRVIAPLLALTGFVLADAGFPQQVFSPVGRKTTSTVKIEGCHGQAGCTAVDINGSISASTTGRATAVAPSYTEGTDNPLSIDLSGNIRTLATAQTAAKATAADPSYTEGTTDPISQDLSGHLRTNVSNFPASQAVTGTFWQATQPVSGTFWQATQPVSGTVAVSNAFALDSSVNGLLLSQGSTTSGQKGPIAQCAVTTAAPTYTTAQTDPLSCTTAGLLRVDGSGVTQPVSGTFWQATQPVSGTFWQATQPISGTVTTSPPANASTNVAQFGGTNVSTGTGAGGTGIPRVTVSNDSQVKPWDGTNTVTVRAASTLAAATDTAEVVALREGARDQSKTGTITTATGTDVMTLGTGQAACALQLSGVWTISGGSAILLFEGSQDGGSTYAQTAAWGNVTGNFFQTQPSAATGNFFLPAAGYTHLQLRASGTSFTGTLTTKWNCSTGPQPPPSVGGTYVANGGNRSTPNAVTQTSGAISFATDPEGRLHTREFGSNPFQCNVSGSTAATTQCQAAAATGFKLYVTDVMLSSGGAAQTVQIKYGTGTNCGTGTTNMTAAIHLPNTGGVPWDLRTPLIAAAANAVCCTSAAAVAYTCNISGYTAP